MPTPIAHAVGLYYRNTVDEITRKHITIGRTLLSWSAFSLLAGVVGILMPWPLVQGIALQALIWGAVDAAIAAVGLHGARRRIHRYPDEERAISETLRLRKTLIVNGWLDVVYLAVGIAVVGVFHRQPFPLGNGIGVMIQAIFLLGFDFGHAGRLPSAGPSWYSSQV
ncbi:MAG TPA: hypothetical protein VJ932_08680 [Alkalispirochaeta sp.]|nr:hypothetical protein [Alkalispirochaeta sp.]